jgi:hypothetical protein
MPVGAGLVRVDGRIMVERIHCRDIHVDLGQRPHRDVFFTAQPTRRGQS